VAAVVSQQSVVGAAASTTTAITPTGITPGNALVIVFSDAGGLSTGSLTSVTDTGGNTWTVALSSGISGVTNTRLAFAYCTNCVAPGTITATSGSIANRKLLLLEISGLADQAHDDLQSNFTAAASTATTVPAVTLSAAGFAIAAVAHGGTTEDTASSGWTRNTTGTPDNTAPIVRAAWQQFNSSGSTGTMTMTRDSRQAGAAMIAFKLGGGPKDAALTSAGTSTSTFGAAARRKTALASTGTSTSTFGLKRARPTAFTSAGTSTSTFARVRGKPAVFTSTGTSASTFTPMRFRGAAFTSAGTSTSAFGRQRIAKTALTSAGTSTSTFGAALYVNFPTTGVLDSFNTGASQALTARTNWRNPGQILSASDTTFTTDATPTKAAGGTTPTAAVRSISLADVEAWTTFDTYNPVVNTFALCVRLQDRAAAGGAATYYELVVARSSATDFEVGKVVAGTFTLLSTTITLPATLGAGDSIGISVVGTSIKTFYKVGSGPWIAAHNFTDSAITAAGAIGFYATGFGASPALDLIGGGAPVTTGPRNATFTSNGTSTSTFGAARLRATAFTSAGTSTSTFGAVRRRAATFTSAGVGTSTFAATRWRPAAFTSTGTSASTFAPVRVRGATFTSAGIGTSTFGRVQITRVAFTSAGTSTTTFAATRWRPTSFTSAGTSTSVFGRAAIRPAALTSTGTSTSVFGRVAMRRAAFASTGTSTTTFAPARLGIFSVGVGTSVFGAVRLRAATFASTGTGTTTFSVIRRRPVAFTSAGTSTTTFTAARRRPASFASSGVGTTTFAPMRLRGVAFVSAGLSASSFNAVRRRGVAFNSTGVGTSTFGVTGLRLAAFASVGTSTSTFAPVRISAIPPIAGTMRVGITADTLATATSGAAVLVVGITAPTLQSVTSGDDSLDTPTARAGNLAVGVS
jgi:hypothetical protein